MIKEKSNWNQIWRKKGLLESNDTMLLNGYENSGADPSFISNFIMDVLKITNKDKVLEVGCGAGFLGEYISKKCSYYGIDKSNTLINKYKNIFGSESRVFNIEANQIPYEDNFFDVSFSFGVFHYFPSIEYAFNVIKRMLEISKRSIFIGDLPYQSHDDAHLLFNKKMFSEGKIFQGGLYKKNTNNRFNVLLIK